MVLMRECWPANRSTDGRSHMVYTRSPGEHWLRKRRWEERPQRWMEKDHNFPRMHCGLSQVWAVEPWRD